MIVHGYMMYFIVHRNITTRRALIRNAAGLTTLLAGSSRGAAAKQYLAYFGTYTTNIPQYGTGESKGIYVSRFDSATGKLSTPELAAESLNPSYLRVHPNRRFLYAVNELDENNKADGEADGPLPPADEIEVGIVKNAKHQMLRASVFCERVSQIMKKVRTTKIAVTIDAAIPARSVTANPRTGPVPY